MATIQPSLVLPGFEAPVPLCIRRRRRKRQKILAKDVMLDYTKNTTLHGLRYISEKGLHIVEKIFWVITFILSMVISAWFIYDVWHKWQTSPIIVSFSETLVPVEKVPFPSITICPELKTKASLYNFTKELEEYNNGNSSTVKKIRLSDIDLICLTGTGIDLNSSTTNASTVENIIEVSPKLEDVVNRIRWHSNYNRSLMSTVLTEEGVCFSFNSLAAEEIFRTEAIQQEYKYTDSNLKQKGWSPRRGYKDDDSEKYPFPGSGHRRNSNLEFQLLLPKEDYDGLCNGNERGFKIYIQHPASHAQATVHSFGLSPGEKMSLAITAEISTTSKKLKKYSSEVRQCYFTDEKYLKYFKLYTVDNCLLECLSNFTFQECQCVPYFLPHDNSSQICPYEKYRCYKKAEDKMEMKSDSSDQCSCLPNCYDVSYEADALKTGYHVLDFIKSIYKLYEIESDYIERFEFYHLSVYFRSDRFMSTVRRELFGTTEFLAEIGGLLGVFLGFSFLSIVELIYFFTLRLGCILKRDIDEEKTAQVKENKRL